MFGVYFGLRVSTISIPYKGKKKKAQKHKEGCHEGAENLHSKKETTAGGAFVAFLSCNAKTWPCSGSAGSSKAVLLNCWSTESPGS